MNSSLSWFVCGIFHIMSIPFNYTNAPIRVVKAIMIGANVVTLCFSLFALFLEFRESAYCQETGRVFGQLLPSPCTAFSQSLSVNSETLWQREIMSSRD